MTDYQPYDSALKSLLGEEKADILPHFLPKAEYVSEQNIEIDRTTLRTDLVYNITYEGELLILNMELQTDADEQMPLRMLKYHVGLHDKHRLPVLSVVVYLFETNIPTPPFEEKVGEEVVLSFRYMVIAVWLLDAVEYVEQHLVCMYTFLPAMKGASASLLVQAVKEMELHYSRQAFVRHYTRFKTILHRTKMLSEQDKKEVEDQLDSYDSLLDNDPEFQERIAKAVAAAKAEAEAEAKARAEVEAKAAQQIIVSFVGARFPTLKELAQEQVALVGSTETLKLLVKQVATVPDESAARWLLGTLAA